MTPWHHALSSAKKFGGKPEDYINIHEWFDCTKQYTGEWTHRAMRHHAAGIQWCIETFGDAVLADGKMVPVKLIAEQHVNEDCGYIPTIQDWLQPLREKPGDWMLKVKVKSVSSLQVSESE
jgi:hypothetical protein